MARINIETRIYREFEFQELLIKVGDRHRAKGMLQELWELAQEHWFPHRRLIPMPEIKKFGLQPVIDAGLAEIRPEGVYARGSEKAFDWLFQKQVAGQASAETKKRKSKKQRESTDVQQPLTGVDESQRAATSLLSSPSSPLPAPNSDSSSLKGEASPPLRWDAGVFIGEFVRAYQEKYGPHARPDLKGKIKGLIKVFVGEHSRERSIALIQTYLKMDDSWFLNKGHDFITFYENLSKIGLKLDTGSAATRASARRTELSGTNTQAIRDYLKESEAAS